MPNVPISGLPLTTSVCATALVPIVQNGVTCSTYACLLGSGGGGGAVTQITAGTGVTISPACGVGNVTICSTAVLPAVGSFSTCVSSPIVCGTTLVCTPTLVSTNACITALNTSGCAVCVGTGGLLTAYTATAGIMIAGGGCNSTLRCGVNNTASGLYSFAAGSCNVACGNYSFIGGGGGNTASGLFSGAIGCNLNACNACTFYVNNFCSCGVSSSATCGTSPIYCGTTCVTAPTTCGTTSVLSPLVCGTTSMCTPIIRATTACITGLNTSGCAVCVGASGLLTAYTPAAASSIMVLGGGTNSTIRCGVGNTATASFGASLSGCNNTNSGGYAVIAGGSCNSTNATHAFIGGGCRNCVNVNFTGQGNCGTIGGGKSNYLESAYGTISGGVGNTVCNSQYFSVIGGGNGNFISGTNVYGNAILSGTSNSIINNGSICVDSPALISGGAFNKACNAFSTVSNGYCGLACGIASTILNGTYNCAFGNYSIVSGICNFASGTNSIVIGCNSCDFGNDYTYVFGCNITANGASCTTYLNNLCVYGTVSKGGGFFKIPHPDPIKAEAGKFLKHSFVESPTAGDNIYRYVVTTSNCSASIELPDYYNLLNGNDQVWVSPICHFGSAYGVINENQTSLSICSNADGDYNVLLIGTRKDKFASENWNGTEVEANE